MGLILKRIVIRSAGNGGMTRALFPFLIPLLMVSCGTKSSEEKGGEVRLREMAVESGAVSRLLPLISPSHLPPERQLTPEQKFLVTYRAQLNPADLVGTQPPSPGHWRMAQIFRLADCVAVPMTEGQWGESLVFVG